MLKAELFQRTLSCYETSLSHEWVTLYKYCKTHRVNYQGLRYWMKKQSIELPVQDRSRNWASSTLSAVAEFKPIAEHQRLMPLMMLSPQGAKESDPQSPLLREVSITIADGIIVCIKQISPADLATLIVSCHNR